MNSVHRRLRDATADAHSRVDVLFGSFDLASPVSYAAFLEAQAGAVLPLEASLDAAGAGGVIHDWPGRRRTPDLVADLTDLGRARPATESASATPRSDRDSGWIGGTLYVLEGSRLGGRVLARRVDAGFPRRFLEAGQATGNWRNLLDRLETILYEPALLQAAVSAALDAFAAFDRSGKHWLSKG